MLARTALLVVGAGAVLLASCAGAREDRDAFVVDALVRSDEVLLRTRPALVAGKYARMHNDAYAFFRGSVPLYVRDTLDARGGLGASRFAVTSPRVPSIGDAHPENFGTLHAYAGGTNFDGAFSLEPNDFDGAERLPYLVDVRRLAIGVAFAARIALASGGAVAERDVEAVAAASARGYVAGLRARANGAPVPQVDWTTPILADLAKRTKRDAGVGKELATLTTVDAGVRRLRRGTLDPEQPWQALGDVPRSIADGVPELLASYEAMVPLALPAGFLGVKDVAREYGSGVASWPRIRLVVLVEGPTAAVEDDVVLEVKELADTSWPASFAPFVSARTNVERVRRHAHAAFSSEAVEPLWQAVPWRGLEWQVRRESEGNKTVRVARMTGASGTAEALAALAFALGETVARVHFGRGPTSSEAQVIGDAVARDVEGFVQEQAAIGRTWSFAAELDHRAFKEALRARGPALGFPLVAAEPLAIDFGALVGAPLFQEPLQ
jgi:uncharacterized protein (DUF2252 family)